MHRFIPEPGDGQADAAVNPEHTAAIRRWTREVLRLDDDDLVASASIHARRAPRAHQAPK